MAYSRTWGKRSTTSRPPIMIEPVSAPMFTPSSYQQRILDWLTTGHGSCVVDATAGSGKTSTLKLLAFNLPPQSTAVFLAFNKSIATELSAKLPATCPASTFHALGFKSLRPLLVNFPRDGVNGYKCGDLFDQLYPNALSPMHGKARPSVLRLVSLAKGAVLLPSQVSQDWVDETVAWFDLDTNDTDLPTLTSMVRDTLTRSNETRDLIDFDDMLYLPLILGASWPTFDFVMVDESQDTNAAQRAILHKLVAHGGRLIAVGDAAQAIYGFRGADSDAMDLIVSEFDAARFPLSISYRCPRAIVDAASDYSANIEAAPNAKDGAILYPERFTVRDFRPSDLVMCRNTAPIIGAAYKCLVSRIPVQVMGREIGNGLKSLIRKLSTRGTTLGTLPTRVAEYQTVEVTRCMERRQEYKAQAIADKCEAILTLMDSMTDDDCLRGIDGLLGIIDILFSDKQAAVKMATIHKSKGLEAQRTYILDAHLMPSKYAKQPHQIQQEQNLTFVAITRSLDTLTYITSDMLATEG